MSTGSAQARWTPLPFSGLAERVGWMTAHRTRPSRRESPPPTPFSWPVARSAWPREKTSAHVGRKSRVSYSPTPPRRGAGQRAGLWALYFLWALFVSVTTSRRLICCWPYPNGRCGWQAVGGGWLSGGRVGWRVGWRAENESGASRRSRHVASCYGWSCSPPERAVSIRVKRVTAGAGWAIRMSGFPLVFRF